MIAIDNSRAECWQQWILCAPEDMELPSSLVHKMFFMSLAAADACVIFRFYSGISIIKGSFQENKKPRRSSPWTMANVVRRVGQSTRAVCAQNVSGMVSEPSPGLKEPVIGVHGVSCPVPPHSHSSAKTRRLHLQPFHSLQFSPAGQDTLGAGAGLSWGAQAIGAQTLGATTEDWRTGREEFGGKLLGPSINPSVLCFPLVESGSAATVSLGQPRHSQVTTQVRWK